MTRRSVLALAAAGVLFLVAVPVVWRALTAADEAVGTLTITDGPSPAVAPASPDGPAEPAGSPADPLAAVRPRDLPLPQRLRVPARGIDARIVHVGVEDDGQMQIPEDVSTVGWYRFGPTPGQPGSAVIAGHVDSRTQGRGAFFDLGRVVPGDVVELTDDRGVVSRHRVRGRETIAKEVVPLDAVFARDGPPHLTLITCGGAFDDRTRHYVSNVIVEAVPVDD